MILRYLTAFGPSVVADAQSWSGLTGLKDVFERLRSTEIEDELVAAEHRVVAVGGERPLRMGSEQVAVRVDHLRSWEAEGLRGQLEHFSSEASRSGLLPQPVGSMYAENPRPM